MTRTERLKAFEMRLDGASWAAIGTALGYDASSVRLDLNSCVTTPPKKTRCCYPALQAVVDRRFNGSTKAFAEYCGLGANTVYYIFSGKTHNPQKHIVDAILLGSGLPYDEAFRMEDE